MTDPQIHTPSADEFTFGSTTDPECGGALGSTNRPDVGAPMPSVNPTTPEAEGG